jgi:hypothetical protein
MRRLREELKGEGSGLENGRSSAIEKLTRKFGALAISLATLVGSPDKVEAAEGDLNDVTVKNSFVMNDTANSLDVDEQGNMVEEETIRDGGTINVGNFNVGAGGTVHVLNNNTGQHVSVSPTGSANFMRPVLYGSKIMVKDTLNDIVYSFDVSSLGSIDGSDFVEQPALKDVLALDFVITLTMDGDVSNLLWDSRDDTVYALNGGQYVKLSNPNSYVMDLVAEAKSKYVGGKIDGHRADAVTKKVHVLTLDNDTGVATHYVNDQAEVVENPVNVEVEIGEGQKINGEAKEISFTVSGMEEGFTGEFALEDVKIPFGKADVDASNVVTIQLPLQSVGGIEGDRNVEVKVYDDEGTEVASVSGVVEVDTKVVPVDMTIEDATEMNDRFVVEREKGETTVFTLKNGSMEDVSAELSVISLSSMEEFNNASGDPTEQEIRQLMGEAEMIMQPQFNENGEATAELELPEGLSVLILTTADDDGNVVFEFTFVESIVSDVIDEDMGNKPDMGGDMNPVDMPDMNQEPDMDKEDEKADFGYEGPGAEKKEGGGEKDEPSCSTIAISAPEGGTGDEAMLAALMMALAMWRRRRNQ